MPLLVQQSLRSEEPKALSSVDLDGTADSFPYSSAQRAFLILQNSSGSPVTVTLLGDEATSVNRQGITSVDVSGGKEVTVPANGSQVVDLINAGAYLSDSDGLPEITGATSVISAALVTA